jgi:hypothetical protein
MSNLMTFNSIERTTTLANNVLITGDSAPLIVTINVAIDEAATVSASVVTRQMDEVLISSTVCDNLATDADWPNGIVAVEFTTRQTDIDETGAAVLMIKVVQDGITTTYLGHLFIIEGTI